MYGYNPSFNNYQMRLPQQYQPQYPSMRQMFPQQAQPVQILNGRIVSGVEEARAAQIEFDGSTFYFPSPSEEKVYLKGMDINGNVFFKTYTEEKPKEEKPKEDPLLVLKERVERLEKELEVLTNGIIGTGTVTETKVRPNAEQTNVG